MTSNYPPTTPPSRRRPVLLPIALALFALITVFILVCMVLPTMPNAGLFAVSVFAYSYNPFLLVFAALGLVLLVVALRRRRRIIAALAGVLTVAVLVAVAVPTAQLMNSAAENNVELSVAEFVQGPEGGLDSPSITTTYRSVDGEDLQMDVWQPDNQKDASNAAMVYVYGGGFSSGTRDRWAPYFQHLTAMGITVFSMDYRLSTPTEPSWDKAAGDVKCAVGWVRENADEYDIDESRIAISGGSAGGNLAMLTAYSSESDDVPGVCDTADSSVRAVVDFYGPPDLAELYTGTPSAAVADSLDQYLGASPDKNSERYAALSPETYVTADAPPTLIIQGLRDTGVQSSLSVDLSAQLDAAGVENELLLLPATEHGFDAVYGSFANQIARDRGDAFLQKYLID
jgi:acetyl esterase/lipase